MIEGLKELGKTILLTTQYMDEAEHLADRLLILRAGEVVAAGTADELVRDLEASALISFRVPDGIAPAEIEAAAELTLRVSGQVPRVLRQNVTSPRGTTAAALAILMGEHSLEKLLTAAVRAAVERSRELSG